MGFFDRIGNWLNTTGRKIYNGIREGVSTGYNFVKNVAHKVGSLSDGIDSALTQARNIPLIGSLASVVQNSPLYNEIRAGIKTGTDVVDKVGEIGSQIGSVLDSGIPVSGGAKTSTGPPAAPPAPSMGQPRPPMAPAPPAMPPPPAPPRR